MYYYIIVLLFSFQTFLYYFHLISQFINLLLLTAAALLAAASADTPPSYGAPPPYHPAPAFKPVEKLTPLSHMLMNMVLLMTTLRLTSRRPRPRMLKGRLQDLSPLPFLMAGSRLPPTLLITTMDLLLRLHMKVPLSTPQSPQVDTDTQPQPTNLPLLTNLLLS